MEEKQNEVQLTKLETVFTVGIIGCLLFATWELAHLTADQWLGNWVRQNHFVRKRVIYYGIAFLMGGAAVLFTTVFAFRLGRFGRTVNRAFLWYGVLLLISTIGIFVFDCLPEVFAGFIGAAVFIGAIHVLQKKFLHPRADHAPASRKGTVLFLRRAAPPHFHVLRDLRDRGGQEVPFVRVPSQPEGQVLLELQAGLGTGAFAGR